MKHSMGTSLFNFASFTGSSLKIRTAYCSPCSLTSMGPLCLEPLGDVDATPLQHPDTIREASVGSKQVFLTKSPGDALFLHERPSTVDELGWHTGRKINTRSHVLRPLPPREDGSCGCRCRCWCNDDHPRATRGFVVCNRLEKEPSRPNV